MSPVVELERLTVRYGAKPVLRDVTAVLPAGAVGLLGPNGAGKSTLLKTLLGFVTPASGRVRVLGLDPVASPLIVRARLGYMPENDAHIPGMNAVSFVAYCGELCGLPRRDAMQRAHEVLQYVGLGEARYRTVETYSTGMKQRIKLAQALVHDPDLLFLDEPTNGMDPRGRDEMLDLIADVVRNKGLSVILSSHVLPDVERTCDHVVVLDQGAVAAQGPIASLKPGGRRVFELRIKAASAAAAEGFYAALDAAGATCLDTGDDVRRVLAPDSVDAAGLFGLASAHRVQVRHLRASVPTLEDAFAEAVGDHAPGPGASGTAG